MPYFDEELFKKNGASQISTCSDQYSGVKYEVSFELDNKGLDNLQTALRGLEAKDDMTQLKTELLTMHAVNNCKGSTIDRRIDNYLEAKAGNPKIMEDRSVIQRYTIKHR